MTTALKKFCLYSDGGPGPAGDAQPPAQPGEPGEQPGLSAETGEPAETEAGRSGEVSGDTAAVIFDEGICFQAKLGMKARLQTWLL